MRVHWTALGALFAFVALMLSVLDVDEEIAGTFPALAPFVPYTVWVVVVATIGWSVFGLYVIFRTIIDWYRFRASKLSGLGWELCRHDELHLVQEMADRNLPDPTNIRRTEAMYAHNPQSIRKIIDNRRSNQIVGYVFMMPLTKNGIKKLENKSFHVGENDLSIFRKKGFPTNCDYYIGAVVGETALAKAKAVLVIKDFCRSKKVNRVFAKAATRDGLRMLKKQGFEPFSQEDEAELGVLFMKYNN